MGYNGNIFIKKKKKKKERERKKKGDKNKMCYLKAQIFIRFFFYPVCVIYLSTVCVINAYSGQSIQSISGEKPCFLLKLTTSNATPTSFFFFLKGRFINP